MDQYSSIIISPWKNIASKELCQLLQLWTYSILAWKIENLSKSLLVKLREFHIFIRNKRFIIYLLPFGRESHVEMKVTNIRYAVRMAHLNTYLCNPTRNCRIWVIPAGLIVRKVWKWKFLTFSKDHFCSISLLPVSMYH